MQPSIFGKPLDEVDFSDVVIFCNSRPSEGLALDFKKDLSSLPNVIKTLVSFANTNGGWLIIGVEDDNDRPKLPISGMVFDDNIIQKVNNAIISMVTPIVLPYYKVCKSPDNKAFLIVHMPQSQHAPHWMSYKNRNTLFIRIADRSTGDDWERYASSSQWEMLRERRKVSVDLRNQLINNMKNVFEVKAILDDEVKDVDDKESLSGISSTLASMVPTESFFEGWAYRNALTVSILPSYPSQPISTIDSVLNTLKYDVISNGLNNRYAQTPNHQGYDTKIYQNGAYAFHNDTNHHPGYYFFGLDTYGNIMYVDPIESSTKIDDQYGKTREAQYTQINWTVMDIVGALQFAEKHYTNSGMVGNILFRAEYTGTQGCLMYFQGAAGWVFDTHNLPSNVTGYYLVQREIDSNILVDKNLRHEFIYEVLEEILYSFNYNAIDRDTLKKLIEFADNRHET